MAEWLKKQSCELGEVHIIMEATGVYHEPLAYGLHFAGTRISLANPHRTREFARGMNILTKNDKVDAWMLACYGSLKEPETWTPPPESVRYLRALLRRRDSLVADSTREKNRLEKSVFTDSPDAVRASIENMLQELRNEIEHLDLLSQEHIETNPELNQDFRLLTSIKSVGYLLGLNMLAILKSHSFESAEQAAAFLGVIPVPSIAFCRLSGILSHEWPPVSSDDHFCYSPQRVSSSFRIRHFWGKIQRWLDYVVN